MVHCLGLDHLRKISRTVKYFTYRQSGSIRAINDKPREFLASTRCKFGRSVPAERERQVPTSSVHWRLSSA